MSVEVTSDLSDAVQEAVASGEFSSINDVLLSALTAWQTRRLLEGSQDEEIGRLWDEGVASGTSIDGKIAFEQALQQFMSHVDRKS